MPNSTRSTVLAVLASLALVIGLTAPSFADTESELKKKREQLNGQIDEAQKQADHSSKELADAQASLNWAQDALDAARGELGRTRGELAVAAAKDQSMQAKLERTEAQLKASVARLAKGEKQLEKASSEVEEFAVQTVQEGDPGMRAFSRLLSGESPQTFSEEMAINDSVGEAQVAKMQELDASRVVLKLKRDEVEKLRDEVKVAREEAARNLEVKAQLEAQAQEQASAVRSMRDKRVTAKRAADAAAQEDAKILAQWESERDQVAARLAALAKKEVASGGKGSGGDSGGTLSYPVNAPVTSPYGYRVHPITGVYKLHDGTDFGAACGTPIKAAASGTVIEQYYNGAYGNRVILNNGVKRGVNVVTTYNHLSRFAVSSGSKVSRGDVIGYVGTTGYSTGCHLHFMVLANGATQNPMSWL